MKALSLIQDYLTEIGLDALIISKPTNRRYLSGFTGTNGLLLITPQDSILVTDFRYTEQANSQAQGFTVIQQGRSLYVTLSEIMESNNIKRVGLEKEIVTLLEYEDYQDKLPGITFVPLQDPCVKIRAIKGDTEIVALKKAVEIADKAFIHILDFISPGQNEKEIATELAFFMDRLGAEGTAFETIVASGERSSLPHGVASSKTVCKNDLVTIDFGAVYQGYHSDMTRTLMMGSNQPQQERIYNIVLKAQEAAIREIQPGIKACEADAIARSIIEEEGFGENFGHGLGHGVGLDIHEGPRLAPQDQTILEPGMVVSVEPGIYIPGWGGVRIEDLVVITPRGCEVLTKSPKGFREMIIE